MKKMRMIELVVVMIVSSFFIACGGGGGGDAAVSAPADTAHSFVTELPVESTYFYNGDTGETASLFRNLLVRNAYAESGIITLPSMANNTIHEWWGSDCGVYDVADETNMVLYPLVGADMKRLVVGQTYHMVLEADRSEQKNDCSYGKAVTGEWDFEITVSVGTVEENLNYTEFESGEIIIELLDNGSDYSVDPIVTVSYTGMDFNGEINGSSQFIIVKRPIQEPEVNFMQFHGQMIQWKKKGYVDFSNLPEYVRLNVVGPHIHRTSWLSTNGSLSSEGLIDGTEWNWQVGSIDDNHECMMILVSMENNIGVTVQRKIMIFGDERDFDDEPAVVPAVE